MNKDEIKDTTEKPGTNKYKNTNLINALQLNYFLSWLFISRIRSLSYGVKKYHNVLNNNHNVRDFFFFFTESISCKNENKDNIKCKDQMQKPEHKTNFDRNIVIFTGSALSFILILAILREIFLVCRFPRPTGLLSTSSDVYADIAEVENRGTE